MKDFSVGTKLLIASAACIASTSAFSQSSVTLFGVLDQGLNYTSNAKGSAAYQMTGIDLATSRWGLKGDEDLGGGLHAIFDLESGFEINSGSAIYGGRLFGYQSYVGLKSEKLGTLTLGRQFDVVSDVVGLMTANGSWAGYLFSHPVDNDNTDGTFHASNSVKYTSATFGGVTAEGIYGFSNLAGGFAQNRLFGGGLSYSYGALNVGAVYEQLSTPGSTAVGTVASDDYVTFTAERQKIWGVGATYGIGNATLGAVYTHTSVDSPTESTYVGNLGLEGGSLKFDNFEVNAKYNFTPSFFVGGMYTYTRAHVNDGATSSSLHWNQFGLMADYSLSKRTGIYAQVVYQNVSNGKSGTPLDVAYIPGAADLSSTRNQTVVRIGMSHTF